MSSSTPRQGACSPSSPTNDQPRESRQERALSDEIDSSALLEGRWVRLRILDSRDYEFLRAAESGDPALAVYRQRGVTLPPEQYVQSLWRSVQAQFIVCQRTGGQPVGVVALYGSDFRNGHGRIAGMVLPPWRKHGWALEGFSVLISYVFRVFNLRKLYADVAGFNDGGLAFLEHPPFRLEGLLTNHEYFDGKYWDQRIYGLTREDWLEASAQRIELTGFAHRPGREVVVAALTTLVGDLDDASLRDEMRLIDDLGVDSIQMFEIAVWLEEAAGGSLSTDLLESVVTVGDVRALLASYLRG